MKNICYLISSLVRTGPTNQLSYIIKYLDRTQYNPIIITLLQEPDNTLISYFEKNLKIEVISLNTTKTKALFTVSKRLKEIITNRNIEVIQTQGILADYISFNQVNEKSVKKISTIRNFPLDDYKNLFGGFFGNLFANFHIQLIRNNSNSFIACSRTISKIFKDAKGIELKYIQNGVDVNKFSPAKNKVEIKKKLGLPLDKTVFISVGSLIPRKDFTTLINGFMKYNIRKESILLIAGAGKEELVLKKNCDDSVVFLGNISNVLEYLRGADCFISSSLSEGLPNSVMEAMACGLPCVLSDIPSHRELNYCTNEPVFFKTLDAKDLHHKINEISDQFDIYSNISLTIIKNNFTASVMSSKYQNLYEKTF